MRPHLRPDRCYLTSLENFLLTYVYATSKTCAAALLDSGCYTSAVRIYRSAVPLLMFGMTLSAVAIAQPATVAARIAAQNALFHDENEYSLRTSPTYATSVGDYRYNDRLADYSLAAKQQNHAADAAFLARIKAIDTAGFSEEDRTSHDLFQRGLEESLESYALKIYEMPISSSGGIHSSLADLPRSMPFDSVKHYEDYVSRLHAIPKAMRDVEELLSAGVRDQLVVVTQAAANAPVSSRGIIAANPFLAA